LESFNWIVINESVVVCFWDIFGDVFNGVMVGKFDFFWDLFRGLDGFVFNPNFFFWDIFESGFS